MRNIILVSALLLILNACDSRFDLVSINVPPTIVLQKDGEEFDILTDSLKTSLKTGKKRYTMSVFMTDNDGIPSSVSPQLIDGTGLFYVDGQVGTAFGIENGGRITIEYEPSGSSLNHKFKLNGFDNFGATSSAEVNLLVFNNLKPVAKMQLLKKSKALQYDLDATGSFDQDAAQGGHVSYFYWKINGVEYISDKLISPFDFPSAGTYDIILKVKDDDGEFSPEIKLSAFAVN